MELDELKNEWQQRDQQLDKLVRLNAKLVRETMLAQQRAELRGLGGLGWVYWISFLVTVVSLGMFLADHVDEPQFFVPALLLQIWVVATHASEMYLRDALRRLDFSAPVLALQKRLEALKQQRLRHFKWAFLTGQVLWWIPFVLILFKGVLGLDLYTVSDFMPRFMAINVIAGLAFIPLAHWLAGWAVKRWQHAKPMQALLGSLSGKDLEASLSFVARLDDFEHASASPA